jgi:hypothetical protein
MAVDLTLTGRPLCEKFLAGTYFQFSRGVFAAEKIRLGGKKDFIGWYRVFWSVLEIGVVCAWCFCDENVVGCVENVDKKQHEIGSGKKGHRGQVSFWTDHWGADSYVGAECMRAAMAVARGTAAPSGLDRERSIMDF